ncbi:Asp-tRNA(Asn)/Glu-tRNA(Gln) amidotransferase GatCAB subunit B, partial [Bacillus cereus]|nr:Asp-tRNA(Asn)/Glu-tRNA(Gln) amidotransferase GatCAB subunit B [Bacillus cereus]
LVELYMDDEREEGVRASNQERQDARKARYVAELGLTAYDAHVLTLTKEMSDFLEETVADGADAKLTSNWLMGEVLAYLNKQQKEFKDVALTTAGLSK